MNIGVWIFNSFCLMFSEILASVIWCVLHYFWKILDRYYFRFFSAAFLFISSSETLMTCVVTQFFFFFLLHSSWMNFFVFVLVCMPACMCVSLDNFYWSILKISEPFPNCVPSSDEPSREFFIYDHGFLKPNHVTFDPFLEFTHLCWNSPSFAVVHHFPTDAVVYFFYLLLEHTVF